MRIGPLARIPQATLSLLALLALPRAASAVTPFVGEIADPSANAVGSFASLALDAKGNPHVAYYDQTAGNLKYAWKSGGAWTIETADGSANTVGSWASLALDAQGNPHVGYWDGTADDLKYARRSGGVWTIEIADGSGDYVGGNTSLAVDAQGNPHVGYRHTMSGAVKYARRSGGVWTREFAGGLASDTGWETSLALDAQGNPHLGCDMGGTVVYARKSGGVWAVETAASLGTLTSGLSLVLDAQGNPRMAYGGNPAGGLLSYAWKSGGLWTIEAVDTSPNSMVGGSLVLAADGTPHVAYVNYSDGSTGDLKYASKWGGAWTIETADAMPRVGVGYGYASLALDAQGNPHVAYADGSTYDLKYADAAVHLLSPASGVTWAVGSRQEIAWGGIGPVAIALATDGTNFDNVLATGITSNRFSIRVPHLPTRFARARIERGVEYMLSTAVTDSFFTINATITLLKFDASAAEDASGRAVRLTWETAPGPEADVRYRIERARGGGGAGSAGDGDFAPIHAGLLDRGEYLDSETGALSRYRLIAVNGLGEEYVLGEAASAPALGAGRLAAYPNPAPGGIAEILFRVPFDPDRGASGVAVDLGVFDVTGRRVRTLASGEMPTGVSAARWDGRDANGRRVAAGVYVLRLTAGSAYRATQRLTVID